jgi:hypothetical protein
MCVKEITIKHRMRRIVFVLVAVAALAAWSPTRPPHLDRPMERRPPISGVKIPPGYRDWRLISVAHEEGNLHDLRAILGNDITIKAYREAELPFPDGTITIASLSAAGASTSACPYPPVT